MTKRLLVASCCSLVLGTLAPGTKATPVHAQNELSKALKKKYSFKTVSCFTCHARVKRGTKDPKRFRNDFGKEFDKPLKDKNITARLKALKGLKRDDPKRIKVTEEVTKEFLQALEQVEKVKSPSGESYGELLKKGTLAGVKPRK